MFDFGTWGEILIIIVAALILIGPKELPTVLKFFGRLIQKFKNLSSGLRHEIDRYIHEGEFEEYTKQAKSLGLLNSEESTTEEIKDKKKTAKKKPKK